MNAPEKYTAVQTDQQRLAARRVLEPHPEQVTEVSNVALRTLLAGAVAGCVVKTSTAPLERTKILLQLRKMNLRGNPGTSAAAAAAAAAAPRTILGTLVHMVTHEGVFSLWKGNGANCVRVIPVYGLKFALNDGIKDAFRGAPGAKLSRTKQMAAGTTAGTITVTATYPLDVIRTRLSLAKGLGVSYQGIWHCGVSTVQREGLRGLWGGYMTTVLSGAPYVGLQMTGYEFFKDVLPRNVDGTTSPLWKVACGALAGVVAQTVTYPGDVVRRRMQTNGVGGTDKVYTSTVDCIRKIARGDGFRGFFAGYSANLLRSLPGAGIQFLAFDACKEALGVNR